MRYGRFRQQVSRGGSQEFKPEGTEPDGFDDDGSDGYGDEYDFDDVYDAMYPNGRDDGYDD